MVKRSIFRIQRWIQIFQKNESTDYCIRIESRIHAATPRCSEKLQSNLLVFRFCLLFIFFFWKGGPFFQSLVYYFCGKVFGASNTGKTQLCLSAVAMCASSGGKVAHFSFFLLVGLLHRITLQKNKNQIMFMLILGCLCGHCWRPLQPKTFRSC